MPPNADPPPPARQRERPIAAALARSNNARASTTTREWRNTETQQIPAIEPDTAASKQIKVRYDEEKPATRLREKRLRLDQRAAQLTKATVGVLALIVFLATGGAWSMKTWYDSTLEEIAALDVNSADIKDAPAQLGDENFLIVGSDTRAGAAREVPGVQGARSDAVMLAHIPEDRDRAVVVSFPRDLEVTRPACQRWDASTRQYSEEVVPGAQRVKLNTAYAVGGPRCVTTLVQQLSGMRMNHFVGIDFQGFKSMVDAVGGVTVKANGPIVDQEMGTIATKAGPLPLDGTKALRFVRARKVEGDLTSDYGRMGRQQQFIGALLRKAMSNDVLTNPSKLTSFVNAFTAATYGENIGVDDMLTLAQSMRGLDTGSIQFLTLPTTGYSNERGNEVMMRERTDMLFQALINDTPLPGEEPANKQDNGGQETTARADDSTLRQGTGNP
ncbi:LCP family protein [Haloechinothrix salitolerans]|uniref:LCP family protein n=1 Tax=Haloechinothrix salitolerans TaxID=926830 RepID=A0ABW2BSF3_9PSEU